MNECRVAANGVFVMNRNLLFARTALLCSMAFVAACGQEPDAAAPLAQSAVAVQPPAVAAVVDAPQPIAHALVALPGKEAEVPVLTQKTTINVQTTLGTVVIEVYPQAAPNAAQRFVELVQSGFYNDTPISRVVPGFVAQFGINWREPHRQWENNDFDDDPTLFALQRGTLAFAKAGPNTNSTQVFINYTDNNRLADPQYNFTTFGAVVSGMEFVDAFAQVGDPGGGLDQGRLWTDGDAYLAALADKPTMIVSASVVE
jgi:peptidyl-prolyl cis-trans isomerase A (cyclophilin A)